MITKLGWLTLEQRQIHLRLIVLYKIIHHLIDIKSEDILFPTNRTTRGNNKKFRQPSTRVDCLQPLIHQENHFSLPK